MTLPATLRPEIAKKADATAVPGATLAGFCKASADPLRLDIMRVLSRDSFGVQELATIFGMPQPGMSHHLKVLSKAGLLAARRQGNSIFYRRALLKVGSEFHDFQASLFAAIDALPVDDERQERIDRIYEGRSAQSKAYFQRNADKFEEQQGLLCEPNQYLPSLVEFLDLMGLPRQSRVMEVGPGQGLLLQELARRFDQLVALDSSEEMLALARGKLPAKAKDKTQFVRNSLETYKGEAPFDAVLLNMVLHHVPSPIKALKKLRQLVRPGRYLLVADLCAHNQEWTRDSCGDVWLGFDPQELSDLAHAAGFVDEQSSYLGLKNGFQIQVRLFHAAPAA